MRLNCTVVLVLLTVLSGASGAQSIHPFAVRVMKEYGIDISTQRSKNASEFATTNFSVSLRFAAEPGKIVQYF